MFVPKKMGMNANHTMQVEYIVKPMYLASLKFSGIFLVLKAYTVQRMMSIML